jgi:hypothetical protein
MRRSVTVHKSQVHCCFHPNYLTLVSLSLLGACDSQFRISDSSADIFEHPVANRLLQVQQFSQLILEQAAGQIKYICSLVFVPT